MTIFNPMERFDTSINDEQLGQLSGLNPGVAAWLNNLFATGSANYNQLALELQREFRQGGSPDVMRMAFDRVNYDAKTGSGNFRIVLDVRFTFGCEDSTTEQKNQTSEWTFALDRANKTITFYNSPFAESRSTADEF
ncbi:hypothetical protein ACFQZS_18520 [Mucilaginibacter calamicampi]|uniref:Uncharacterized protein n=1 Tax=Mucilaginibacter calamicampi TaxID=1302352 RepID=A0ABW2Z2X2_9SPHI